MATHVIAAEEITDEIHNEHVYVLTESVDENVTESFNMVEGETSVRESARGRYGLEGC